MTESERSVLRERIASGSSTAPACVVPALREVRSASAAEVAWDSLGFLVLHTVAGRIAARVPARRRGQVSDLWVIDADGSGLQQLADTPEPETPS